MSIPKNDVTFSLKVTVNKEKTKVLFAEVDSCFADVLLSFLTLPLGMIVRILKKHYGDEAPVFGSLNSLYNGLANLDSGHFWTEGGKSILLHPRSSSDAQRKSLMLDISDPPPSLIFSCVCNPSHSVVCKSMYYDRISCCPYCINFSKMKTELAIENATPCGDGVFMISIESVVITDALQILPPTTGLVGISKSLGITDMVDQAGQVNVAFGLTEFMDLLKNSLISSTPLSDIVLNKSRRLRKWEMNDEAELLGKYEQIGKESTSNFKKMILSVILQISTNKLLYAQAEEDFIEFLFSFLIIPLGGVECLLMGNSLIKSVDSLYKSIADLDEYKYFKTPDAKSRLIKPKIPHGYLPQNNNHILPLIEEELIGFYKLSAYFSSFEFPKGQGKYLKAPRTFMVTDDLTVTPHSIASTISFLQEMKISISDVKEVEMHIGLKEALGILRASLTSTCALSNGLNLTNHLSPLKQPKQEH